MVSAPPPPKSLTAHLIPVLLALFVPVFAFVQTAAAQSLNADLADAPKPASASSGTPEQTPALTMFPHPDTTRYFIAGQANIIFQSHGPFHSPYEGTNSLLSRGEYKTSMLGTTYLAVPVAQFEVRSDGIFDNEFADGRGITEALGLAGATDLDVVRNPNLGKSRIWRAMKLHQVIGLQTKR